MPKGITIEIKGLKDLQKRVGSIAPAIMENVDKAMHLAANDFVF